MWKRSLVPAALALAAMTALGGAAQRQEPAVYAKGLVSTDAEEYRISFTADGATAYFARGDAFFPQSRRATIYVMHYRGGKWSPPEVAPFSGKYSDIDPFVTPDGSKVFFSSIRPVGGVERKDADLWVVEKTATGWSEPRNLGALNSPSDELYPSVSGDGTIYFGSDRLGGEGGWDIYAAEVLEGGGYGKPESLAGVNTIYWDFNPTVSHDGKILVFTSLNQPSGQGAGDLYVSFRYGNKWLSPRSLGTLVNTRNDEYHPSLSPNGKYLFFVRRLGGTTPRAGDIYAVPLAALDGTPPPEERPRLRPEGAPKGPAEQP